MPRPNPAGTALGSVRHRLPSVAMETWVLGWRTTGGEGGEPSGSAAKPATGDRAWPGEAQRRVLLPQSAARRAPEAPAPSPNPAAGEAAFEPNSLRRLPPPPRRPAAPGLPRHCSRHPPAVSAVRLSVPKPRETSALWGKGRFAGAGERGRPWGRRRGSAGNGVPSRPGEKSPVAWDAIPQPSPPPSLLSVRRFRWGLFNSK